MKKKRITKIEIENYRAFYARSYTFTLGKGENLLVYGENGSGKTSLYHALKDYFESTDINSKGNWYDAGAPGIALTFAEFENGKCIDGSTQRFPPEPLEESGETEGIAPDRGFIDKINLAKGFFSYRELLATHLDTNETGEFDLFNILVERVLHNYTGTGQTESLSELWRRLTAEKQELVELKAQNQTPNVQQIIKEKTDKINTDTPVFHDRLTASVNQLVEDTNRFNEYFRHGVSINFDIKDAVFDPVQNQLTAPKIFLEVKYNGYKVEMHHQYLNEARLSALAISMFLASVLNNPTIVVPADAVPQNNKIEGPKPANMEAVAIDANGEGAQDQESVLCVLFLDDIFLGLDTGNRLPLLDILQGERFADFQLFMTTYDRAWFELSKDRLQGNWKAVEMYAHDVSITEHPDGEKHQTGSIAHPPGSKEYKFEKPLIIDPSLDYLEKAKLYFDKKDYPAAGNALRKACEKVLKSYLPKGYLMSKNGEPLELGNLILNFTTYFEDANQAIPRDLVKEIVFFKNALLNPSSHHDLRSSIYRHEVEKAIKTVGDLLKLPKISWHPILHPGQELNYEESSSNFKVKILIGDYVYKTVFNGSSQLTKIRFYPDWWEQNGIEYLNKKTGARFSDQEIAKITTQSQDMDKLSSWIQRFTGKPVDCVNDLIFESKTLNNLITAA